MTPEVLRDGFATGVPSAGGPSTECEAGTVADGGRADEHAARHLLLLGRTPDGRHWPRTEPTSAT
ncbi:hypothetical protein ACFWBB_12360 [Streptomyces sp. NPDC060000]|uniref:hypothetical protein n=1 Tax=Streptomyces sp. NPDC060000 TaxID=3347031 RepID=UPI0036930303